MGFRWIRYLKEEKRLQLLEEAVPPGLGVDALVSTNAVHLYYDLPDTLASWTRVLKPGGSAFVQSGNIRNPAATEGEWIIDETVDAIHKAAVEIVRSDDAYRAHRAELDQQERMGKYDALRKKYFLPVRPLDHYLDALRGAGFVIEAVENRSIEANVQEWYDFLAVYHDGVLGWVGGVERIEGQPPTEEAVQDRLALIRAAMDRVFEGREAFQACWTYITCRRRA